MCACARVRVCACACVRVCVCARARSLDETLGIYSESQKASLDYLLLLTTKAQGGASALSAYVDFDSANSFT